MKYTSQTGLLSSVPKRVPRGKSKQSSFNLEVSAQHAPITPKPLAGLFNPFAKGCSLLCNHPAMPEVKKMLQIAKGHLIEEGKSLILPDEIEAIRAELSEFQLKNKLQTAMIAESSTDLPEPGDITEIVPEEMFRRYTETDSRPLTPTPTLASAHTRASASRRCVTPDPIITSKIKEKTLLVLDLRRSHSQETLSCYGGSACMSEMPLIRILNVNLTPASSRHSLLLEKRQHHASNLQLHKITSKSQSPHGDKQDKENKKSHNTLNVPIDDFHAPGHDTDNEEYIKRRGKKRKKRRASSSVSVFRTTTDPETLVAGLSTDSKNASARPSLNEQSADEVTKFGKNKLESDRSFNIDSFLDYESLRQLRRELTSEIVDMEFDDRRKIALQEAFRTISKMRVECEELKQLQMNLLLPEINSSFRFSLPQKFSRSSVRFELPMDSRKFNHMTPMKYIKDHVFISSSRKLLYLYVFNLHCIKPVTDDLAIDEQSNDETKAQNVKNSDECNREEECVQQEKENFVKEISGSEIILALGVIMNKPLSEQQASDFHYLMGWSFDKNYCFKTFSAICAICERLLASEFYPNLPDRKEDPCETIEVIDFEFLERKTKGKSMDLRLLTLLNKIKVL